MLTLEELEVVYHSQVRTPDNVIWVRNLIHGLISGHRDADHEDLVQKVFTNAWGALGMFRGGSTYRTWLYRITMNATFDELRRVHRNSALVSLDTGDHDGGSSLQELLVEMSPLSDPHRYTYSRKIRAMVQRSLNSMSPLQAEVLKMWQMGLRHKEIATILGTTEVTSKNYTFRAKQRIREDLRAAGVIL